MARQINAEAFTVGSNVYFRDGGYAPGSTSGDRVLGHELTHVVQNDQGRVPSTMSREPVISQPTDDLEQEAYAHESVIAQNVEDFRAKRTTSNDVNSALPWFSHSSQMGLEPSTDKLGGNDSITEEEVITASSRAAQ